MTYEDIQTNLDQYIEFSKRIKLLNEHLEKEKRIAEYLEKPDNQENKILYNYAVKKNKLAVSSLKRQLSFFEQRKSKTREKITQREIENKILFLFKESITSQDKQFNIDSWIDKYDIPIDEKLKKPLKEVIAKHEKK